MASETPDTPPKIPSAGPRVPGGGPSSSGFAQEGSGGDVSSSAPGIGALTSEDLAATAREMLYDVIDPELGVDIVNLGLLRNVSIEGARADVRFTVTTPACPLSDYIENEIRTCLWQLPGIRTIDVTCEHEPPWKPEDMSDEARRMLGWDDL
jgi:metal-sulfur cluster biosynthetic enzyme